jgi:hypothetical protein
MTEPDKRYNGDAVGRFRFYVRDDKTKLRDGPRRTKRYDVHGLWSRTADSASCDAHANVRFPPTERRRFRNRFTRSDRSVVVRCTSRSTRCYAFRWTRKN